MLLHRHIPVLKRVVRAAAPTVARRAWLHVDRVAQESLYIWGSAIEAIPFHERLAGSGGHPQRLSLKALTGQDTPYGVTHLAAGMSHGLVALEDDGSTPRSFVYAFGLGTSGQLGLGKKEKERAVGMVEGLPDKGMVVGMAAGRAHSVVAMDDGHAYAFGSCMLGQCGTGKIRGAEAVEVREVRATRVTGISGVTTVACGMDHTLFLTEAGEVWACGWGPDGQLGQGVKGGVDSAVPVKVTGAIEGHRIVRISTSTDFSLAISDTGKVFAWGNNEYGQCATTLDQNRILAAIPVDMGKAVVVDVAAGSTFSLFLTLNGELHSCGFGAIGRPRQPGVVSISLPRRIFSFHRPKHLFATLDYGGVLDASGVAHVWGLAMGPGRLGLRQTENQMEPHVLRFGSEGDEVLDMALGTHLSLALCGPARATYQSKRK